MNNGISVVKKVVSILLLLAALAVLAGSVIYSLMTFGIIGSGSEITSLDQAFGAFSLVFVCGSLIMIGGFAAFGLSVISIIISAVGGFRRPHAFLAIVAVLQAAVSFLMIPFSSFSNAISFAMSFSTLMTSAVYTDFAKYFGLGSALFSLIILILAIADLVKTGRGE